MAGPYLGAFAITGAYWLGSQELYVTFTSEHSSSTYYHQLYVGRQLVGVTESTRDREVVGTIEQDDVPEEITLVAVDSDNRLTDYGSYLPDRPYARVRASITTSGWGSDTRFIEFSSGTEPSGAVDTTNVIGRVEWVGDSTYYWISPPFTESGTWNLEAAGRDGTIPNGNRGTALAFSAALNVYPKDVVHTETGPRLTASIATGTLTVAFTEPS